MRPVFARFAFLLGAVLGAVVLASCGNPTGVDVDVTYDTKLDLDQLIFHIGGLKPVKAPSTPKPLTSGSDSAGFILPDTLANADVTIDVDGINSGNVVEHGAVIVHTKAGAIVTANVTLKPTAGCGDSKIGAPEECDDGNLDDGDGCDSSCKIEVGWTCNGAPSVCQQCGDGIVQGTEQCDDANFQDGDGCSSCATDPGFACTGGVPGLSGADHPSVCAPVCGDGALVGGEACDDNNTTDGDGCSSTCTVEDGFHCNGAPSTCVALCGDGLVRANEACDDANQADGDGCSSTCTVETGFTCGGGAPGNNEASTCTAICGDGLVLGAEQCDDHNTTNGDGCSSTCTQEAGFTCTNAPGASSTCTAVCGDGLVRANEACDDGNQADGDGCSSTCTVETGFTCPAPANAGDPSVCTAICGDGLILGAEQCDDSNTGDGDGCSSSCQRETGFTCNGAPSTCTAVCGDGLVRGTETCDDANTTDGDGCSSTCGTELGFTCDSNEPSACSPICGDALVRGGEQCDDGSDPLTGNSDSRANACRTSCTLPTCGDGVTDDATAVDGSASEDELCDDGFDFDNHDGCLTGCRTPKCGDGFVESASEACDDGNTNVGDGCDGACAIESGFACGGEPSVCVFAANGNPHLVSPGTGTISAAIVAATAGDTLFLAPGAYSDHFGTGASAKSVHIVGTGAVTIAADNNSDTITVGNGVVLTVQGVTITNTHANKNGVTLNGSAIATFTACTIGPTAGIGVQSAAGTNITLERVFVTGNAKGGVNASGAYRIENTAVKGNGNGGTGAFGVSLALAGTFDFNTVTGNTGDSAHPGVQCALATSITSSIVFGNTPSNASAACNVSTSDTTVDPQFDTTTAGSNGFHLKATSPELDKVTCPAAGVPLVDIDGDARPIGGLCDVGADERP